MRHSGHCGSGESAQTLNLAGIHTTWTESVAIPGKAQVRVREGLDGIRSELPCQTVFDSGSLFRPYHSVNTDTNKRIGYLSSRGASVCPPRTIHRDCGSFGARREWRASG